MADTKRAEPKDAPFLADLYAKLLSKTGFKASAAPEKHGELIVFLESLCKGGQTLICG